MRSAIIFGAYAITVSCMAQAPQVFHLLPNEIKEVYTQANVSGKVFVKIVAKMGDEPCADFWWISWPLGNVEQLGRHCQFASFAIPSLWSFSLSSELRVGGIKTELKLGLSADEEVARSLSISF